jgi:hypothetical protein
MERVIREIKIKGKTVPVYKVKVRGEIKRTVEKEVELKGKDRGSVKDRLRDLSDRGSVRVRR